MGRVIAALSKKPVLITEAGAERPLVALKTFLIPGLITRVIALVVVVSAVGAVGS